MTPETTPDELSDDKQDITSPSPLSPEALCHVCDPGRFCFTSTDDLPYAPDIIGQARAVAAIRFGMDIPSEGFNLFVMGPTGTGRRSILRRLVHEQAARASTPDDWAYVYHFADPGTPRALHLPAGWGRRFRDDMAAFSRELGDRLRGAFETAQYAEAREALTRGYQEAQQEALAEVDRACRARGFTLVRDDAGLYISPLHEGEPLPPAEAKCVALSEDRDALEGQLAAALRRLQVQERQVQAEVARLDREVADAAIGAVLEELQRTYADIDDVVGYLAAVRRDVVANVHWALAAEGAPMGGRARRDLSLARRYRVNLLVDRSDIEGAPVVHEDTPTYEKLFGCVVYDVRDGSTTTDYTLIRPGALHRANGGYLLLNAAALLDEPEVWAGLKRALFDGQVRVESPNGRQLVRMVAPEPAPIPLRVKIVLLGSPAIYYALYDHDPDFAKLFKVLAEFNSEMDRTPAAERAYARFVRFLCRDEDLPPFAPDGVARVVEYGARRAGHQDRLSTHFGGIADLVREAAYWARQCAEGEVASVRRADVVEALRQQRERVGLPETLDRRSILEGEVRIDTSGAVVGQVNGLTVLSLAGHRYGVPCRITARAYVGRGNNVLDIHREVNMGGPLHGKGLLTLVGYFGGQYGLRHSLSMEASLSFEQLYDDIDGDSASSAELYALISALSRVPLRQDLAVTGAVDQAGRILPIGAVNEKVEGFFAICRERSLTGSQGVLIPQANVKHLMLDEEVVDAVHAGRFHVYAVTTVDEGLELLTGRPAGTCVEPGVFSKGSVHAAVAARLRAFADRADGDEDAGTGCEA